MGLMELNQDLEHITEVTMPLRLLQIILCLTQSSLLAPQLMVNNQDLVQHIEVLPTALLWLLQNIQNLIHLLLLVHQKKPSQDSENHGGDKINQLLSQINLSCKRELLSSVVKP